MKSLSESLLGGSINIKPTLADLGYKLHNMFFGYQLAYLLPPEKPAGLFMRWRNDRKAKTDHLDDLASALPSKYTRYGKMALKKWMEDVDIPIITADDHFEELSEWLWCLMFAWDPSETGVAKGMKEWFQLDRNFQVDYKEEKDTISIYIRNLKGMPSRSNVDECSCIIELVKE